MLLFFLVQLLGVVSAVAYVMPDRQDELHTLLNEIVNSVESQGSIKLKNGSKSGWHFEPDGCACIYRKVQYVKSGTNYSQIDWTVSFDLGDMESAQYIEYDNHAVILRTKDGHDLVQTSQVKLYRDYTTTEEQFRENSVYIDVRNRADVEKLVDWFQRSIKICSTAD